MNDDILRDDFQLVTDDGHILFLTQQFKTTLMVVSLHTRIGHQVEEVEFNPLNVIVRHTTANIFHHHLVGFPWQPINQMRHNLSLWRTLTHTLNRLHIEIIAVCSVNELWRFFISRLQAKFDGHMHTFCEFCQIINHIVWQTVWAGTDIDTNNTRLIDSLFVAFLDNFKRRVGIGKVLKINQIFLNFWPLAVHEVNLMVKLLTNRCLRCYNSIPRPRYRTKGTATMSHCAITVGTIKTRIYW